MNWITTIYRLISYLLVHLLRSKNQLYSLTKNTLNKDILATLCGNFFVENIEMEGVLISIVGIQPVKFPFKHSRITNRFTKFPIKSCLYGHCFVSKIIIFGVNMNNEIFNILIQDKYVKPFESVDYRYIWRCYRVTMR